MTKEEALKIWLPVIKMGVETMPECEEALDMAIKALEQEPKTEAVKTAIIQELKDHFIEPEDAGLTIKGEYWLAREVLVIIEETEPKAKMVEP